MVKKKLPMSFAADACEEGEVLRGAGEVLLPGEPILTVVASQPSEVIAYAIAPNPKLLAGERAGVRGL